MTALRVTSDWAIGRTSVSRFALLVAQCWLNFRMENCWRMFKKLIFLKFEQTHANGNWSYRHQCNGRHISPKKTVDLLCACILFLACFTHLYFNSTLTKHGLVLSVQSFFQKLKCNKFELKKAQRWTRNSTRTWRKRSLKDSRTVAHTHTHFACENFN